MKLSTAQLTALTTNQIAALSSSDLNALATSSLNVLTTSQIAALTTSQFSSLTTTQLNALTTTQIAKITTSDLNALSTSNLQQITTSQLQALTTSQIRGLSTANVAALTSTQFASLTTTELSGFTTAQFGAVPIANISALTTTQFKVLSATPLVLDLKGDGIQTLSQSAGVNFDLTNSGKSSVVGWVAPSDGLLVEDLNNDGQINNGSELFGSGTNLADGTKAVDGFQALSQLDSNHDGVIDAKDTQFSKLSVWVDANSDGVTDAGELKSLTDLGVQSLNLAATTSTTMDNGNLIGLVSSYTTTDGQTKELADVWLATSSSPLNTSVNNLTSALNAYLDGQSPDTQTADLTLAKDPNAQGAQSANTGALVNALSQFDANGNLISNVTSMLSAGVLANNTAKLTQTAQNNDSQVLTSTPTKPIV